MPIYSIADVPIPPDHLLSVAHQDAYYCRLTLAHASGSPAASGVFHALDLLDVAGWRRAVALLRRRCDAPDARARAEAAE